MEAPSHLSELKILVVEDSEDLTAVWRKLFKRAGISACFCNSGRAALSMIEGDFHPHILMTDYYLPDTTGLELVSEVRKRSKEIDCLMVTGNRDDTFMEAVSRENVSVLLKPLRFPELLERLSTLSTRHRNTHRDGWTH
ncbi:response regulator [Oligoflexus tunisiensis]|uniref:response regulator n=1 Tax=Oligoflexus tunisiensis TaxID=708132 RepID=UPI00114CE476|nr:response regulator [Oligoflexus tunisiensis]